MTSPAHTRSQRASRAALSSVPDRSRKKQAPRRARISRRRSCSAPSGRSPAPDTGRRAAARPAGRAAPCRRRGPRGPAPTHATSPAAARSSRRRGEQSATRDASTSRSSTDAGMGTPWSWRTTSYSRSTPRASDPTPCQAGRNRASTSASTGSTSRRRAASDRWRSERSTSGSHHSRSRPSGRNSPRSSSPRSARAAQEDVDDAARAARSAGAGSADVNGPWVRAHRPSSVPRGSSTGLEEGVGQAGRRLDAEGVAVAAGVLGGDEPALAGDPDLDRPAVAEQVGGEVGGRPGPQLRRG